MYHDKAVPRNRTRSEDVASSVMNSLNHNHITNEKFPSERAWELICNSNYAMQWTHYAGTWPVSRLARRFSTRIGSPSGSARLDALREHEQNEGSDITGSFVFVLFTWVIISLGVRQIGHVVHTGNEKRIQNFGCKTWRAETIWKR